MNFAPFFLWVLFFPAAIVVASSGEEEAFRVGDRYLRTPLVDLNYPGPEFRETILSIVAINRYSGIYLGPYNNRPIVLTSALACGSLSLNTCGDGYVRFLDEDIIDGTYAERRMRRFPIKSILYQNLALGIVLIELKKAPQSSLLMSRGLSFARQAGELPQIEGPLFSISLQQSADELTAQLIYTRDDDCKVMNSKKSLDRRPPPEKDFPRFWSFAHACDSTPRDLGSPLFSLTTNKFMGIQWSGRFPKQLKVQTSAQVSDYVRVGKFQNAVWDQFNLAVPVGKIQEVVQEDLKRGPVYDADTFTIVKRVFVLD